MTLMHKEMYETLIIIHLSIAQTKENVREELTVFLYKLEYCYYGAKRS